MSRKNMMIISAAVIVCAIIFTIIITTSSSNPANELSSDENEQTDTLDSSKDENDSSNNEHDESELGDTVNSKQDENEQRRKHNFPGERVELTMSVVEWDSEVTQLENADEMYYSDSNLDVIFRFRVVGSSELSLHMMALDKWYPSIEVFYEKDGERKEVNFESKYTNHEGSGQIRVMLEDAPKQDLQFKLISASDEWDTIERTMMYTDRFYYTMTSNEPFYNKIKDGQSNPSFSPTWRLFSNEEIDMLFTFSKHVNTESVESRFDDIFDGHTWSLAWQNDKEVVLKVVLQAHYSPSYIIIDLSGIKDRDGRKLVDHNPITVSHSLGYAYGTIDADTLKTIELLRLPQYFFSFVPSDDGKLALAQVSEMSDAGPSQYIVLDLEQAGDIIEIFPPYAIENPRWVKDRQAFVYTTREDSVSVVKMYDMETKQSNIIWTSPYDDENHDGLRWAKLYTMPGTDQLYIIDLRSLTLDYGFFYTADLYEMADLSDRSPRITTDFMRGRCDGMICDPRFQLVAPDVILYMHYDQDLAAKGRPEFYMHNTAEQKRVKINLDEDDGFPESVIALDSERVLVVTEQTTNNRSSYAFNLHYPWEERNELQFQVNDWQGYSTYGQTVPLSDDRYLIGVSDRGAIVDFVNRELTMVDYTPINETPNEIFWMRRLE